jgi:hypothetical protein
LSRFTHRTAAAGRINLFDTLFARRRRSEPPSDPHHHKPFMKEKRMAAAACLIALAISGLVLIVLSEIFA